MSSVEVVRIVGDTCITVEQGAPVYEEVNRLLQAGENVVLDFAGVTVCASPFLNAAVGKLLKDFDRAQLADRLKIRNMTVVGEKLLTRVIENSNRFYRDPNARRALEDILKESDSAERSGRDK